MCLTLDILLCVFFTVDSWSLLSLDFACFYIHPAMLVRSSKVRNLHKSNDNPFFIPIRDDGVHKSNSLHFRTGQQRWISLEPLLTRNMYRVP